MHKIIVKRLPLGEFTVDGAYWPTVDGCNVGEGMRCHWHTETDAHAVAERYVAKLYDQANVVNNQ